MMFNWWSWCFDIQTSGICNGMAGAPDVHGLSGSDADRWAGMRKNETGNGQVIDFEDYRNRRALREWAVRTGFGLRRDEVMG